MKRVSVELTEEEAKMLYLPKPCAYWITQEYIPAKFNESDKTVFTLNGITHDPITREGIEGLGFTKHSKLPYYVRDDYEVQITNDGLVRISKYVISVIFKGNLQTMKQLKDVLKWTGVL